MRRERFLAYVRDALGHLDDHLYLDTHPLAEIHGVTMGSSPPGATRRVLLECIRGLRPAPGVPADSPAWRRHRYLELRYLEGKGPGEVARDLNVSPRQCQRDHVEAVEALGSILWARYGDLAASEGRPDETTHGPDLGDRPTERGNTLQSELLRAAEGLGEGPTALGDVIRRVVGVVLDLAREHQVRLKLAVPAGLPPTAVNANVLRHALLSLLSFAIERSGDGLVTISALGVEDAVRLEVAFRPRADDVLRTERAVPGIVGGDDPLVVIRPLLAMQGGRVELASRQGRGCTVSFQLPLAEATTVLVIDD